MYDEIKEQDTMKHDDCIFCKIVEGTIPSAKVYEDDVVYAFLDLSQVSKGHTLVIPKEHTRDIFDMSPDLAAQLYARVPKIAQAIKTAFNAKGMNILNNNEAIAGQSVFHLHLHLLPKFNEGEGFEAIWKTNEDAYTSEDLEAIASSIHTHIEN